MRQLLILIVFTPILLINCGEDAQTNSAPIIQNQSFSIDENVPLGTVIGIVLATDQDSDELGFSITSGNQNEQFSINSITGELSNLKLIDYEVTPSYALTVLVSDGIESSTATITINVVDVEENNSPVFDTQSFEVSENVTVPFIIGTLMASDDDGDDLSFEITGGNDSQKFSLTPEGQLSVVSELNFDLESNYTLEIDVTDGLDVATNTVSITVLDVTTVQEIADLLSHSWMVSVSSITFDGGVPDGTWTDFTIVFQGDENGGSYATAGVPDGFQDVWPSGDTWVFENEDANTLIRGVDESIMSLSVSATELSLTYTVVQKGARVDGLYGEWHFEFDKIE